MTNYSIGFNDESDGNSIASYDAVGWLRRPVPVDYALLVEGDGIAYLPYETAPFTSKARSRPNKCAGKRFRHLDY